MSTFYEYPGDELKLFSRAVNYKAYLAKRISKHLRGSVLEVGAGIGANIVYLANSNVVSWTCLEPDNSLLKEVPDFVDGLKVEKIHGTLDAVSGSYDTILYIDVLEHIVDDAQELHAASEHISRNFSKGKIVVVAPAHSFIFSPFDKMVGHCRRYSRQDLNNLVPQDFKVKDSFYLDSVGYFLSLANRFLLKQLTPTFKQIAFWDKVIVPLSQICDAILMYKFGKTVVTVYERNE